MANANPNFNRHSSAASAFEELFLIKLQDNINRKRQENRVVFRKIVPYFTSEIRSMMYALGDARHPLYDTAKYMEGILRDQMNLLLAKVSDVTDSREHFLTHEQLLLLLAGNKTKMTRLLHYLYLKDSVTLLKKNDYKKFADRQLLTSNENLQARREDFEQGDQVNLQTSNQSIDDIIEDLDTISCLASLGPSVKTCLEYLKQIDAGDYDVASIKNMTDSIYVERLARRFQMSLNMSTNEYLVFSKKQRACFYPKGGGDKFKRWIVRDCTTTLIPTPLALDILSFFMKETLAEVVEAALPKTGLNASIDSSDIIAENVSPSTSNQQETLVESASSIHDSSSFLDSESLNVAAASNSSHSDVDAAAETSGGSRKRKRETMDMDPQQIEVKLPLPQIPARNVDDPITVYDIAFAVRNLIMHWDDFSRRREKRIICL